MNVFLKQQFSKDFGVNDLLLYGYWASDSHLEVVGQIVADKLDKQFYLVCSAYDKDGDVIKNSENDSYGSGLVTSRIKPESFFNGFPFTFSMYGVERKQVKELRIVVSE